LKKLKSAAICAQLEVIESLDGKLSKGTRRSHDRSRQRNFRQNRCVLDGPTHQCGCAWGFVALGDEILVQIEGRVDAVCDAIGTSGMLIGMAQAESPILSAGCKGSHTVDGVGLGFVPVKYEPDRVDGVRAIPEAEARVMCRALARHEGIFCATSSGMNAVGAIQIARELGPDSIVVAVACDTGLKYLNSGLFD
jgi:hypothetical protein